MLFTQNPPSVRTCIRHLPSNQPHRQTYPQNINNKVLCQVHGSRRKKTLCPKLTTTHLVPLRDFFFSANARSSHVVPCQCSTALVLREVGEFLNMHPTIFAHLPSIWGRVSIFCTFSWNGFSPNGTRRPARWLLLLGAIYSAPGYAVALWVWLRLVGALFFPGLWLRCCSFFWAIGCLDGCLWVFARDHVPMRAWKAHCKLGDLVCVCVKQA